jgi:hypothetical protein
MKEGIELTLLLLLSLFLLFLFLKMVFPGEWPAAHAMEGKGRKMRRRRGATRSLDTRPARMI